MENKVELFREERKYDFCQRAKYDSRAHPTLIKLTSNSSFITWIVIAKKDYLVPLDITSDYPACMKTSGFYKERFRYPTLSSWSDKPEL